MLIANVCKHYLYCYTCYCLVLNSCMCIQYYNIYILYQDFYVLSWFVVLLRFQMFFYYISSFHVHGHKVTHKSNVGEATSGVHRKEKSALPSKTSMGTLSTHWLPHWLPHVRGLASFGCPYIFSKLTSGLIVLAKLSSITFLNMLIIRNAIYLVETKVPLLKAAWTKNVKYFPQL